ncbi:GTPase HflX, partial [Bienertia sinuspersici]
WRSEKRAGICNASSNAVLKPPCLSTYSRYTNARKSKLLNQLSGANVLVEDRLFATLDPTTKRVQIKNGKEFIFTNTVRFIQKLPTMLVAAFRATLEEVYESSVLVHIVNIRHPLAKQQIDAVDKVLLELDVSSIPTSLRPVQMHGYYYQ